jgi:hypothetical protein
MEYPLRSPSILRKTKFHHHMPISPLPVPFRHTLILYTAYHHISILSYQLYLSFRLPHHTVYTFLISPTRANCHTTVVNTCNRNLDQGRPDRRYNHSSASLRTGRCSCTIHVTGSVVIIELYRVWLNSF